MSGRLTQWISLGLVLAALAVSAVLYGDLPSQVATHFNAAGEPDGWSNRPAAALMMPAIMVGLWLMLWVLPKISPQGWRVEPFADVWNRCQLAIIAFMLLMHVGVLGHAVGWWGADMGRVVTGFTGVHQRAIAVIIGVAVLVPVVYSFFAYRAIEGFKPPPDH